ncbi:MAG: Amidophosphoribosyltransferase [Methanomicrobiales archaeon 53_19]|jgi:amidophosphoribosyltransferase|uniref:amidophosphoribosyltransferase n=1 Tax=Methanocalculus sp. TaxID=2004547 RepID=UPI000749D442|nr:amidophosphoribosyltransferase [Methanocalculus sp.]KUL02739.1 MAG: Amidophosphoribosyltransferase [Methanomicrobiales archaeon 53_19]HIJ07341.1 amidophosphoribosyltransferase [Methanocalculus sp.]
MCGIVGIVDTGGVSFPLYYALYALQHRGQESAGISTFDAGTLFKHKAQGLLSEVFNRDILEELPGSVGIGHVRYPTTGENRPENTQPLNFSLKGHHFSIVHNGNLVNNNELVAEYEEQGHIFATTTDSEVIAAIIARELTLSGSITDAVVLCMRKLQGSYSVITMLDDTLFAFRDPLGIKPLCIGKTDNGYMVASESVALDALGAIFIRDLRPGELITIDADGISCHQITHASNTAFCLFEYIYFARSDSVIDGVLVYDVRRKVGEMLHKEAPVNADIISPVPDSGTSLAVGYSEASGIPFKEGLIKNRYIGRTFIMPTQKLRENAVRMKLNPVRGHIKGKSVVLVDDSIVRGTTSRRIIELVREFGAREVHFRVGSPPVAAPCYLGVDLPTRNELIAHNRASDEVCSCISADSLHHISLKALIEATGIDMADFCTGCLTGCYPVAIPHEDSECRHVDFIHGSYQTRLDF